MSYKEYKKLDLPEVGNRILDFWTKESVFEKSVESREGRPTFTFYEGPPSANGLPGIHHVMARTIKDIFCRYKTLKGFQVKRKGGWDTHGLPIELSVEKTLGITKEDIGIKISIEDYNKACRREVMKYKEVWDDLTRKMGYWVDLDHPYITFENNYIESVWHLLSKLYEKNLLYKGYTIQPYSPAAGTGLSSHELNQPGTYRMVKDTSAVAQFRVKREPKADFLFSKTAMDVYILAWTTTPWTLPSNCALAVGKKIEYVLVETYNPYTFQPVAVVLAKDLLPKYFSDKQNEIAFNEYEAGGKLIPWRIVANFSGVDMLGLNYEQLMPYVQPEGKAFTVIPGDFVTTDDGTGIVHTASVFGADDFRVCNENGISSILVKDEAGNTTPLVDKRGRFVKEVIDYANEFVKEDYLSAEEKEAEKIKQGRDKYLSVDERIAIQLKKENKAFKVERYEHSYPHCWRTDKPVLYYPLDSWFIKTTACKERLISLNKTINWKPESTGTGRFGNWLENLVDWNLSRSRFWGIPLPIWTSEDRNEQICVGSVEELKKHLATAEKAGIKNSFKTEGEQFDLHRPYVDDIVLVSATGKKMFRESDLIDVWFDSGAMPYAQWHFPFENLEEFEKSFPADFIAEGVDQTRGWFFTLHAIAVMLFDSVAFKNVVSNGLVLDKNGNKMSKRLGNAVDPFETINKFGPDATRWYLISNAQPWDNLKFNSDGISEVQRKFFGTLYNTYSFFTLYANIDGFSYKEAEIPVSERPEIDQWILSELNSLIGFVDECYADYEPTKATRAIQEFVDEHLSNWYVRLCRRRFWKGDFSQDKIAAYQTLYRCLEVISQLMAPVAPFFAEQLFNDLNRVTNRHKVASVHLSDFPVMDSSLIDKNLEERMELAQKVSSMVLALRKKVNIRVRQPLSKIMIPVLEAGMKDKLLAVKELILAEVNVKEMDFIVDTTGILVKKVKPNFKVLGKKAGPLMKVLSDEILAMSQTDIAKFEAEGKFSLSPQGQHFEIVSEDVEVISEDIPGWQVNSEGKLTVALDVTLTESLKEEGIARELVNRIQNIRKDKGFEVTDKITVKIKDNGLITNSVKNNFNYICNEVLADSFSLVSDLDENDGILIDVDDQIQVLTSINKITHGS
ncbi:MAG: isoleucine--tRNA ligase [Bacteroidetes bacterium]|nr:isoleucine--tRNA ligase [Bacteroidota bacterium]